MGKTITFNVTPISHLRTTQGDRIFFRIPREKLFPSGLRRLERIEQYNKYKIAILAIANSHKFTFPYIGAVMKFYLPVPKSWSDKKKKLHHLQYHTSRKDLDNLIKGVLDAMMKEDKHIAHFEAAKYWVNADSGYLTITDTYLEPKIK